MTNWENIIQTAMLGTDKSAVNKQQFSFDTQPWIEMVEANTKLGKEEKFLQIATVIFNHRMAGSSPLRKEEIKPSIAPPEIKSYCSFETMNALNDILAEESHSLLELWLKLCASNDKVVEPEWVPTILSVGQTNKKLRPLISQCAGTRGAWLCGFNEAWKYSGETLNEESWQTGTLEQRVTVLKEKREANPKIALQWLIKTWDQEDANTKSTLLSILELNLGEPDISFIEKAQSEKSKKVREEALRLLKLNPQTSILKRYAELVKQSLELRKEKVLMGLSSKTIFHINLSIDDKDPIFQTGIEKLSSQKDLSDEVFIVSQLLEAIPPFIIQEHLNSTPSALIELLQKDKEFSKLLPSLVNSTKKFRDIEWARAFMRSSNTVYIDLLPLLPVTEKEEYAIKYFDQYPEILIEQSVLIEGEWSFELCRKIFRYLANNPYRYNRSFFNVQIQRIPLLILRELEKFTPSDAGLKTQWINTSEYIEKLLLLKIQVLKAFNV